MSMFEMYNKLNDTASHKDTTAQRPLIGPLATKTATPIKKSIIYLKDFLQNQKKATNK